MKPNGEVQSLLRSDDTEAYAIIERYHALLLQDHWYERLELLLSSLEAASTSLKNVAGLFLSDATHKGIRPWRNSVTKILAQYPGQKAVDLATSPDAFRRSVLADAAAYDAIAVGLRAFAGPFQTEKGAKKREKPTAKSQKIALENARDAILLSATEELVRLYQSRHGHVPFPENAKDKPSRVNGASKKIKGVKRASPKPSTKSKRLPVSDAQQPSTRYIGECLRNIDTSVDLSRTITLIRKALKNLPERLTTKDLLAARNRPNPERDAFLEVLRNPPDQATE